MLLEAFILGINSGYRPAFVTPTTLHGPLPDCLNPDLASQHLVPALGCPPCLKYFRIPNFGVCIALHSPGALAMTVPQTNHITGALTGLVGTCDLLCSCCLRRDNSVSDAIPGSFSSIWCLIVFSSIQRRYYCNHV